MDSDGKVAEAKQRLERPGGSRALVLYAVGARDVCDFIDMLNDEGSIEVLALLHNMLTAPNDSENHNRELNAILAPMVERELERRDYEQVRPSVWEYING